MRLSIWRVVAIGGTFRAWAMPGAEPAPVNATASDALSNAVRPLQLFAAVDAMARVPEQTAGFFFQGESLQGWAGGE